MMFRMNDLKNFMEVAVCKTMREAARKLGITQPALSESIKRLESDLKGVLLYRARTGITLTPVGTAVFGSAKSALSFLTEIESINNLGTHFGSRTVTVGCHPTVACYCLPNALRILEQASPDYKIHLRHDLSRNIQTEIQQGHIDIGIVVNATPSPDLVIRKIAVDKVTVWATKRGCSNKVFCNFDLVQTQSILRKWKPQSPTKIHSESLELIARLASEGLGYAILPERVVRLFDADLKQLTGAPAFHDSISVVYRPEFGKSQIESHVVKALTMSLTALP